MHPIITKLKAGFPVIGAPMFLVSGPELVIAQCQAGIVGTFPSLNARPVALLSTWIKEIKSTCAVYDQNYPDHPSAAFGVNLVVHPSNPRWQADLEVCVAEEVPLVITSLHPPTEVVKAVHAYGGLVLHDVTTLKHAKKALSVGVDGLILVCAGAGGHAGLLNPFAFVNEVREFYDGFLTLAGCMSHGKDILAAQVLGADACYLGTRFLASQESLASSAYRDMVINAQAADIVYTPYFSGVAANYLIQSIEQAGVAIDQLSTHDKLSVNLNKDEKPKAWKDIWSAGQGVGSVQSPQRCAEVINQLSDEYHSARSQLI